MTNRMLFVCSKCDAQFIKWSGRCLECGAWGSLAETATQAQTTAAPGPTVHAPKLFNAQDIKVTEYPRQATGIIEFDRVMGGGIVPGSLTLLGGDPGIGKTTLALSVAAATKKTLYISGEETPEQVLGAVTRLGLTADTMLFLHNNNVAEIIAAITEAKPALVVVDSIQTIASPEVSGEPGSVTQIRAATAKLLEQAKTLHIAIIIIGHVTKDGAVAGPKTLEHLVDTVLYFEGDPTRDVRLLRSVKNRFGSTNEIGVFQMTDKGLEEVRDPSQALADAHSAAPGSVITCLMEGTRPLLIEVQALVNKTMFGYPERRASGFDANRLKLLLAVLESRAGLKLGAYDVHVNVVGGIRAKEPAADLAVALAVASAYKQKVLPRTIAAFGEVDLSGNIRGVNHTKKRMDECTRLGIKKIITADTVNNITDLVKQTD